MRKTISIDIGKDDFKGMKYGESVKVSIVGRITGFREQQDIEATAAPGDNKPPKKTDSYLCVDIEPSEISIGGAKINPKDRFEKDYDKFKNRDRDVASDAEKEENIGNPPE